MSRTRYTYRPSPENIIVKLIEGEKRHHGGSYRGWFRLINDYTPMNESEWPGPLSAGDEVFFVDGFVVEILGEEDVFMVPANQVSLRRQ